MAKREECKFDTDGFIESFQKEAVPSYHSAKDSVNSAPPESDRPPEGKISSVETSDADSFIPPDWFDPDEDDTTQKYVSLNMTDSEIEYIKEYIVKNNFKQVSQRGRQVMIREKHRKRIKDILDLLGEDANMATYIDNVLTEHFKNYYQTIMGIAKKCPPKFR